MATTMTLDEAREQVREVEAKYRSIEQERSEGRADGGSPEQVLRDLELTLALAEAARELVAAKGVYAEIESATADARRQHAAAELVEIEAALGEAVVRAEKDMAQLQATLQGLLGLAKQRYATRHEMTGGAPITLLARGPVAGWIKYRLGDQLDLADLGHAEPHYRGVGLGQILGLTSTQHEEDNDGIQN